MSNEENQRQKNAANGRIEINEMQNRKTNSIENKVRKLHVFILLMIIP